MSWAGGDRAVFSNSPDSGSLGTIVSTWKTSCMKCHVKGPRDSAPHFPRCLSIADGRAPRLQKNRAGPPAPTPPQAGSPLPTQRRRFQVISPRQDPEPRAQSFLQPAFLRRCHSGRRTPCFGSKFALRKGGCCREQESSGVLSTGPRACGERRGLTRTQPRKVCLCSFGLGHVPR